MNNCIYISDDDDEDDVVPLKLFETKLKNGGADCNSFEELYKYSMETCEFCQAIFHNKFDMIIHNASHIIVPLIKQSVYQCTQCFYYFTSTDELLYHKSTKHGITISQVLDNKEIQNIKSRLIFEEEINETDLEVGPVLNGIANGGLDKQYGKLIIGSRIDDNVVSVHYKDLIRPGLYRCKRCRSMFPNRFQSIIHETTHLASKKHSPKYSLCCICDKYIAGDHNALLHHTQQNHNNGMKRHYIQNTCKKCGLKYHDIRKHLLNYHLLYHCTKCHKRFDSEKQRTEHYKEHKNNNKLEVEPQKMKVSRIVQMCEVCYMFLKETQYVKYQCIGEYSHIGERQLCERCGKDFFDIKLVRMKSHRQAVRMFEESSVTFKKKPVTNESRLKNIQQRLKMLNKLTRF